MSHSIAYTSVFIHSLSHVIISSTLTGYTNTTAENSVLKSNAVIPMTCMSCTRFINWRNTSTPFSGAGFRRRIFVPIAYVWNENFWRWKQDSTSVFGRRFAVGIGQQMTSRERDCGQLCPTNRSCVGYMYRSRLSTAGDRAFGVAARRLWNSLPACVTSAKTLSTFKKH